jgi:hypothetical protein
VTQHFAFNPVRLRRGFVLCAFLCTLPGALSVRAVAGGAGLPAQVRAGLCVGLLLASGVIAYRLRPRKGWGVTLDDQGFGLGRASGQPPLRVMWPQVESVQVLGPDRSEVALFWNEGRRVLVSRRLFAHPADFQAFLRALEKHVPPPTQDA